MGTKACEKLPSAYNPLMKLANLKETKKASMPAVAPKKTAMTTSRTNPKMLDNSVIAEITLEVFNKDGFLDNGISP
jgi:hypothetical protein